MTKNQHIIRLIRSVFSLVDKLDRKNLPLLRILPSKFKRNLFRRIYKPITKVFPKIVKLNDFSVFLPRELDYSYILQEHELGTQQIIRRHLKPGMIAIDVGANIGYLTLLMAKLVGPKGKIYAVEPAQDNLEFLRRNVRLNGAENIEILPYAAGAEHCVQNFYLRKAGTLHSLYSPAKAAAEITQVQVMPLDELIREKRVDFIKIDVEGGEIEVLKGSQRILQSNAEIKLILEMNAKALRQAGHTPEELSNLLLNAGFNTWMINENTKQLDCLEQMLAEIEDDNYGDKPHFNVFAQRASS